MSSLPPQCMPHSDEVLSAQVPGCYLKAGRGYQPDSAHIGSPGQSPLSFSNSRRLPTAPFRTSPLQPSQNPARPSAEQPMDAADSASAAGQLSGGPDKDDAALESKGQADVEQEPQHASSNGLQHREELTLSGLGLQETGDEAAQHSEQQMDGTTGGHLSTGSTAAELQHKSNHNSAPHEPDSSIRQEHPEGGSAAASISPEASIASSGTEAQPTAETGFKADLAASSAAAEPELVAVAERAEHAAAAVAAEGLELDRSSEPAAMAAARSGSLAPGDISQTCCWCLDTRMVTPCCVLSQAYGQFMLSCEACVQELHDKTVNLQTSLRAALCDM